MKFCFHFFYHSIPIINKYTKFLFNIILITSCCFHAFSSTYFLKAKQKKINKLCLFVEICLNLSHTHINTHNTYTFKNKQNNLVNFVKYLKTMLESLVSFAN